MRPANAMPGHSETIMGGNDPPMIDAVQMFRENGFRG